jgi:hypothetical protein
MSVPYPGITRRNGHGAVVCNVGVHVHRPSRLGAAAPILDAKLPCGDGVSAMRTRKRSQAVFHLDAVMSHSFKCSRLFEQGSAPKLLRLESASTNMAASESVEPRQYFICAGRMTAVACDFHLPRSRIFGLPAVLLAFRWNADTGAGGRISIEF